MELQKSYNPYDINWRFIEENLPNYSSRDDVLLSDILLRYVEGDDVSQEDLQMIKEDIGADRQKVLEALMELDNKLMNEAMANGKRGLT